MFWKPLITSQLRLDTRLEPPYQKFSTNQDLELRIQFQGTVMLYWSDKFIRVHSLPEIWLWNEDMAHGQHTKSSQLFWSVKYNRREPTRHLGIQPDLDTCLDLEVKNNSIWRTTFEKTADNAKQRTLWPVTIVLLLNWNFHLWIRSQSMI